MSIACSMIQIDHKSIRSKDLLMNIGARAAPEDGKEDKEVLVIGGEIHLDGFEYCMLENTTRCHFVCNDHSPTSVGWV